MYRLRFETYYKSHPEYRDISKIKASSNQKIKPVEENINEKAKLKCKENSMELKAIICNIETNLELALLNLKRSNSHLQYIYQ